MYKDIVLLLLGIELKIKNKILREEISFPNSKKQIGRLCKLCHDPIYTQYGLFIGSNVGGDADMQC